MPNSRASPPPIIHTPTSEGITYITLSRPHARNAVDSPTALKLYAAFRTFDADASQKVCILHGAHGTFCAGYDLNYLAQQSSSPDGVERAGEVSGPNSLGPMGPTRLHLSKPLIAAISGYAVAGGLELSLLADLRVMEEDAILGVFCRRFGVPLIDGGTVRLQRIVGLGRALDMVLTGRAVGAEEALGMGLANRVVAKGKGLEAAVELARGLLGFPQGCMNVDRASVYHAAFEAKSFDDALGFEYREGVKVVGSESVEGARRFRDGKGRHGKL